MLLLMSGIERNPGPPPSDKSGSFKYGMPPDHILPLSNSGTNQCFVNAGIQLLRASGYKQHVVNETSSKPLASALKKIFLHEGERPVETGDIRTLVANSSGKQHLDERTQEDAQEFLATMEEVLAKELDLGILGPCRAEHWGQTETSRRFRNSVGGACQKCGRVPLLQQEVFFDLPLALPAVGETSLESILMNHFAENTEDAEPIKCSICCPHDARPGDPCNCDKEEIVEKIHLTKAPTNIFVTLKRRTKTTRVTMQEEFELEGAKYKLIGVLSHRGETITSGHYYTYLRHKDSWFLHEDAHPATPTQFHQINTSESYILLGRKCEATMAYSSVLREWILEDREEKSEMKILFTHFENEK